LEAECPATAEKTKEISLTFEICFSTLFRLR
jgi:hypothetical protein